MVASPGTSTEGKRTCLSPSHARTLLLLAFMNAIISAAKNITNLFRAGAATDRTTPIYIHVFVIALPQLFLILMFWRWTDGTQRSRVQTGKSAFNLSTIVCFIFGQQSDVG